jgi:hypothetical protein
MGHEKKGKEEKGVDCQKSNTVDSKLHLCWIGAGGNSPSILDRERSRPI